MAKNPVISYGGQPMPGPGMDEMASQQLPPPMRKTAKAPAKRKSKAPKKAKKL